MGAASMHEQMEERRYESQGGSVQRRTERTSGSPPHERLRLQYLTRAMPGFAIGFDRRLRRHGLTAERVLLAAIEGGHVPPERVPKYLDALSTLELFAEIEEGQMQLGGSVRLGTWVQVTSSTICRDRRGRRGRVNYRGHYFLPRLRADLDELPCDDATGCASA